MTTKQIELIRSTWDKVSELDVVEVGELFYTRLFSIAPQLAPMFHAPIPGQSKKLMATLGFVIAKLDKLDTIIDEVTRLAQRHVQYGVKPAHYAWVGEALLWTLEKGLDKDWTPEVAEAWTTCYSILSTSMINGAEYAKNTAA